MNIERNQTLRLPEREKFVYLDFLRHMQLNAEISNAIVAI